MSPPLYAPKAAKQTVSLTPEQLKALDAYESAHGSFPEMAREHYRDSNNDEPNNS